VTAETVANELQENLSLPSIQFVKVETDLTYCISLIFGIGFF